MSAKAVLVELIVERGKLYIQRQRDYVYVYIRINGLLPHEARMLQYRYGGSSWSGCYYHSWSSGSVRTLLHLLDDLQGTLETGLHRRLRDYCVAQRGSIRSTAAIEVANYLQSGSVNLKDYVDE